MNYINYDKYQVYQKQIKAKDENQEKLKFKN